MSRVFSLALRSSCKARASIARVYQSKGTFIMAKTTQAIATVRVPTNERTKMYICMLTRAQGVTPAQLKEAVLALPNRRAEGYTSHNSYSLNLLARTYGYRFIAVDFENGQRHYFFESPKNADFLAPFFVEVAKAEKAAAREAAKAEREAIAAREAAKAAREARKLEREAAAAIKVDRKRARKPAAPATELPTLDAQA
jgi:hypothetical protein